MMAAIAADSNGPTSVGDLVLPQIRPTERTGDVAGAVGFHPRKVEPGDPTVSKEPFVHTDRESEYHPLHIGNLTSPQVQPQPVNESHANTFTHLVLSPAGVDRRAILAIVVTTSATKPTELTYRNDLLAQKSVTYDDLGGWQWILAEGINIQDMESHGYILINTQAKGLCFNPACPSDLFCASTKWPRASPGMGQLGLLTICLPLGESAQVVHAANICPAKEGVDLSGTMFPFQLGIHLSLDGQPVEDICEIVDQIRPSPSSRQESRRILAVK